MVIHHEMHQNITKAFEKYQSVWWGTNLSTRDEFFLVFSTWWVFILNRVDKNLKSTHCRIWVYCSIECPHKNLRCMWKERWEWVTLCKSQHIQTPAHRKEEPPTHNTPTLHSDQTFAQPHSHLQLHSGLQNTLSPLTDVAIGHCSL